MSANDDYVEFELEETVKKRFRFFIGPPLGASFAAVEPAKWEHFYKAGWCRVDLKEEEERGRMENFEHERSGRFKAEDRVRELADQVEVEKLAASTAKSSALKSLEQGLEAAHELMHNKLRKCNSFRAELEDQNRKLKEKIRLLEQQDGKTAIAPHPAVSMANEALVAEAKADLMKRLVPGSRWVNITPQSGNVRAWIVGYTYVDGSAGVTYRTRFGESTHLLDWFLTHYEPEEAGHEPESDFDSDPDSNSRVLIETEKKP